MTLLTCLPLKMPFLQYSLELVHKKLSHLVETLVDPNQVGVSGVCDLKFVVEDDIRQHLTTIEVRKLISSWKADATPVTQSSVESRSPSTLEPSSSGSANDQGPGSPGSSGSVPSVPWHKMPDQLMEYLSRKQRPPPRLRKDMVRIVIDCLHKPGQQLPRTKTLRFIAHDIVTTYPFSFRDEVDGEQVGSGHDSLLSQLVNRVDNLSRATQHNSLKRSLSQHNANPPKKLITDSYGCTNWQPDALPRGESDESQKITMEKLKNAYLSGKHDVNISALMKATYATQRQVINRNDCVLEDVIDDWPYLFKEKYMLEHFKELVGIDVMEKLKHSASTKMTSIINFMKVEALRMQKLTKDVNLVSQAMKDKGDNVPCVMGTMLLLSNYLQDDFSEVVLSTEHMSVKDSLEDLDSPGTPCIVAVGNPLESTQFHISIAKKMTTKVNNPLSALSVWFSSFFIFNLQYPAKAAAVCEFVQRCFVGINPPSGSKSSRGGKKNHINPLVLRLTNKIKDFELKNEWNM